MIIELLPLHIVAFLKGIEESGFSLCLIGGSVRDYFFLNQTQLSNLPIHSDFLDLDFEIRPSFFEAKIETKDWENYYNKLLLYFKKENLEYTQLPYLITKVFYSGIKFEFSSPRLEIQEGNNFSHHHFFPVLDPYLNYAESFKRRDLTINAIGAEFNLKKGEVKIIDPYGGIKDLSDKVLRNISNDFFFDSVRFLRLIRFQVKFSGFKIEEHLSSCLNLFNLSELSRHHFIEELFKANSTKFLILFSQLVKDKALKIPNSFIVWIKYDFQEMPNLGKIEKTDFVVFVFIKNKEDAKKIFHFFSLPEKKWRSLNSYWESCLRLRAITDAEFVEIKSLSFLKLLNHPILRDLKNLEDKKEWNALLKFIPDLSFEEKYDCEKWNAVKVSGEELESVVPSSRSFYKYAKVLKEIIQC